MTPNEVNNELRDQLTGQDLPADPIAGRLGAHKRRRDAAIDAAIVSMPMRVQRALNARASAENPRRIAPWAYAMSAVAAVVILLVQFAPRSAERADSIRDTMAVVAAPAVLGLEQDVDVLVDELLQRNGMNGQDWTVTEGDVDQLLGDEGIDL